MPCLSKSKDVLWVLEIEIFYTHWVPIPIEPSLLPLTKLGQLKKTSKKWKSSIWVWWHELAICLLLNKRLLFWGIDLHHFITGKSYSKIFHTFNLCFLNSCFWFLAVVLCTVCQFPQMLFSLVFDKQIIILNILLTWGICLTCFKKYSSFWLPGCLFQVDFCFRHF